MQHRAVDKIVKVLERGLDPNFHDLDTGGKCDVVGPWEGLTGKSSHSWGVSLRGARMGQEIRDQRWGRGSEIGLRIWMGRGPRWRLCGNHKARWSLQFAGNFLRQP